MKTMKGPGLFLAQFVGDEPPFNSLESMAKWASEIGYHGVQIPTWDKRLFDLDSAAESKDYCDQVRGILSSHNLEITELSTHLQGQLVAVHPAFDDAFDGFAAEEVRGNPKARTGWAINQLMLSAKRLLKILDFLPMLRFQVRWHGHIFILGHSDQQD